MIAPIGYIILIKAGSNCACVPYVTSFVVVLYTNVFPLASFLIGLINNPATDGLSATPDALRQIEPAVCDATPAL